MWHICSSVEHSLRNTILGAQTNINTESDITYRYTVTLFGCLNHSLIIVSVQTFG